MRRFCIVAALLLLVLRTSPFAVGQKKPREQSATKDDYKLLDTTTQLQGTLTYVEPTSKLMKVKVGYAYLEPNPQYHSNNRAASHWLSRVNHVNNQYQQALRIRSFSRRIMRLQQLATEMQVLQLQAPVGPPPFRTAMAYKDVDAEATENVVVRRSKLPVQYDDKGNVKEYTEKEKRDLQGSDSSVPGYKASWEDVQIGQKVKLYLKSKKAIDNAAKKSLAPDKKKEDDAKNKDAAKDKDADKDKDAAKNKDAEKKASNDDADQEPRAHVYMILIQAEPDSSSAPANTKKRKANDN